MLILSKEYFQYCLVTKSCLTLCDLMDRSTPSSLSFTISQGKLKLMPIESVMQINHLLPPYPFASVLSSIRVFSSELGLRTKLSKYQSFTFSITLYNENTWLISIRIDWFDLLVIQGILNIFSSTVIQKHRFFGIQSSLWYNSLNCTTYYIYRYIILITVAWYMTTEKNHSFNYMEICRQRDVSAL